MKQKPLLLILIILITACSRTTETAVPTPRATTENEPTRRPALTPATAVPIATETTTAQPEIIQSEPAEASIPTPALFQTTWNDREPYRLGLIPSEQSALDTLPQLPIYHLDLQINDELNIVNGRQQLYYTNLEDTPLDELYFHLFPNLLGGEIDITAVTINDQPATPSYGGANRSEMRLPLPTPLPIGESAVIHIDFTTHVPLESGRNYGVFALVDDILALAHFYPQLAVYDDEGWNIDTPTEGGDVTYADTSFYLVRITAPANLPIATAGIIHQQEVSNITQQTTYAAGPIRDFYLAASYRYEIISHTSGDLTINSYVPAEFAASSQEALGYAISAIEIFNQRFTPYPYTELDMVTTPTLALGVEYPTIIANRLDMYAGGQSIFLESTTAHEIAHQWFYALVGNDQLDEPWLDESLTQYATYLYYLDQYGTEGGQGFYQSLQDRWEHTSNTDIPIGLPVASYKGNEYGAIVYGRGPIFVDELAKTMGQSNFDTFIRDYVETYKWGVASTENLKSMAESHCTCDLTALFEAWVFPN